MTQYFKFSGQLLKETGENQYTTLSSEEFQAVILHLLDALDQYESEDGFKFVDIDADGTLSTGQYNINQYNISQYNINWSNYGLNKETL